MLSWNEPGGPYRRCYTRWIATARELWNSGKTITSFGLAGLSAGTGQVYVVTYDNTVWALGFPLEH